MKQRAAKTNRLSVDISHFFKRSNSRAPLKRRMQNGTVWFGIDMASSKDITVYCPPDTRNQGAVNNNCAEG